MEDGLFARCVNVDWLEVYVLEDNMKYPCNADYFRERGYIVSERPYGTRQYQEMFVIQDHFGQSLIEIRRNPFSGASDFTGLNERSSHIRLTNRLCYLDNAVRYLGEFLIAHDYELQRIYRIDVCYDFRQFDYGDDPARFIRRYMEKKFSKVNQCKVKAFGDDGWTTIDWESVSWGSPTSMVGTKIYNKTKELAAGGNKKPWIVQAWFESGLIENPTELPDVWRIEFSLHSSIKNWIVIEDNDGKHERKRTIPHSLELFDGRDRLWQRFQDLAHHYFRFKRVEYLEKVNSDGTRNLKRKDLCADKRLFKFDVDRQFYKVDNVSRESFPSTEDERLKKKLIQYRDCHVDRDIRQSCDIILNAIDREQLRRITKHGTNDEIDAIRLAIATRTDWDFRKVCRVADQINELIKQKEIW